MPRKKPAPNIPKALEGLISSAIDELKGRPYAFEGMESKELVSLLLSLMRFKLSLTKAKVDLTPEEVKNSHKSLEEDFSELEQSVLAQMRT